MVISQFLRIRRMVDKGRTHGFQAIIVGTACLFAQMALAADTISITVMEIVDNAIVLLVPGAMDAGTADALSWVSLAFALAVAFVVTFPVNRYPISRGLGHAFVHGHHG